MIPHESRTRPGQPLGLYRRHLEHRARARRPGRDLGDATLIAAIFDRAMHTIHVNITGPSYRQHVAKPRADRAPVA